MRTAAGTAIPSTLLLLSVSLFLSLMLPPAPSVSASPRYSSSQQRPIELLPTDHWAYEELRKLWVAGILDSFFVSTRPVSRYDIAAMLISLLEAQDVPVGWPPVERLLREFSREMRYIGAGSSHREKLYRETPFLLQRRSRDLDFRISVYGDAGLHKEGRGDPVVEEGSRAGVQIWAILWPGTVVFEDLYAGKHSEAWRYSEELFGLEDVIILSDRFYVTLRTPFLDAAFGRDKLRWGPGRTGTLLLSDAAPSYTLFSATKTLGRRFKVSILSAILDSEEGKYLAGHRLDIVPWDFLQVGLHETAIYHSRFIEPLYAMSLIPFTLVERLLHRDSQHPGTDDPLRNNVAIGGDVMVRPLRGVSLYGELMIDDLSEETSKRPTRLAYQVGTAISRPTGGPCINFTAELSRVWNYTYSVSYSDIYDRDHSHGGVPLGYYLGPDSRRIFVLLSCDISLDLEVGLTWDEILKGEGTLQGPWREELGKVDASSLSGIVETQSTSALFMRWLPRDDFLLEVSAGLKDVRSENHVRRANKSRALLSFRLAGRW